MNEAQFQAFASDVDAAVVSLNAEIPVSKLKALASVVRDGVASMETDAEKLAVRMESLKKRGADAFGKLHAELDAYEQAVNEAEQSLSQTSNGGPPLGNS